MVRSSMCQLNVCCKFSCQQNDLPGDKLVRYIMFRDSIETLVGDINNVDDDETLRETIVITKFQNHIQHRQRGDQMYFFILRLHIMIS